MNKEELLDQDFNEESEESVELGKEDLELITNEGEVEDSNQLEQEQKEIDEEEMTAEKFLELKERMAKLEAEKEKHIDRIQRLQAEFSNYKKRVQKEKQKLRCTATEDLLIELLPVVDNFERALNTIDDGQDLDNTLKGLGMVSRQLNKVITDEGVEEIATIGEEFDPNLHEAVMKVESEQYEEGIIVEELQRGYLFEGQVLRPAMVKVAE